MSISRAGHLARAALAALLCTGLIACDSDEKSAKTDNAFANDCDLDAQKYRLRQYMDDQYFWYASMPHPDATLFADITSYFYALRFTGDAFMPRGDIWSYAMSTTDFNAFYTQSRQLGWGFSVTDALIPEYPGVALLVRYVEPQSPAAQAGLLRGETLVSINNTPSFDYLNTDPYSLNAVLTAQAAGDRLDLVVRNAQGIERNVAVFADSFSLTPMPLSHPIESPAGKPIGYVMVKDFTEDILTPLETAFADFKAMGIQEIVIDLRYNGGGLASAARTLASYAGGSSFTNSTFAQYNFNDKNQEYNFAINFEYLRSAMPATRVFVLTSASTCSASELVINSLTPFVDVVQIGGSTCGKPVGFIPYDDQCGILYSAVNFEVFNAAGEGRYWNGLAPRCVVADDFSHPLGDSDEALLATARHYVDQGECPITTAEATAMARKRTTDFPRTRPPIIAGEQPSAMILP